MQPYLLRQALQVNDTNDCEMDPEMLRRVNESRKLLLRAGADPTLNLSSGPESFVEMGTINNVPVICQLR